MPEGESASRIARCPSRGLRLRRCGGCLAATLPALQVVPGDVQHVFARIAHHRQIHGELLVLRMFTHREFDILISIHSDRGVLVIRSIVLPSLPQPPRPRSIHSEILHVSAVRGPVSKDRLQLYIISSHFSSIAFPCLHNG